MTNDIASARLERAADIAEVLDVIGRYHHGADFLDWDMLENQVFTLDAVADYNVHLFGHPDVHLHGRPAIIEWLKGYLGAGPACPKHLMSNHIFDHEGDLVRSRSYLMAGSPRPGMYTFEHVRTPEGWRIKRFLLEFWEYSRNR